MSMLAARVVEFDPRSKRVQCWWADCDDQAEVLVLFEEDPQMDDVENFPGFLLLCPAHYDPLRQAENVE